MKVLLWSPTIIRATPEERSELRPIGRSSERFHLMVQELEDLAVAADDHGIDAFGSTEHHFHTEGGESMPNGLLLYSKLAAKTKRMMFIPVSIVLPARDPLRVAEDIALFDQMYPGRVGVCFARGYQTRWMQTLAQREKISSGPLDPEANEINREVFDEYLEVVLKAWTEDSFSFEGKHYQVPFPVTGVGRWPAVEYTREYGNPGEVDENGLIREIGVVPKPLTQPHPPVFVPYTLSRQTLVDAAQRGMSMFVYDGRPERFRSACEDYKEEAALAGRDLQLGQGVAAVRKIFLGKTFDEAMDLATRTAGFWFHRYFSLFGYAEANRTERDDPNKMVSFSSDRECAERMFETKQMLCGTPDDVCRQLEELHTCHSDGQLEWLAWEFLTQGNADPDEQKRQLDLFATKVRPNFE